MPIVNDGRKSEKNLFEKTKKLYEKTCIVCAKNQPGLKLDFNLEEDGSVSFEIVCPKSLEGFKDYVHGGVIASIMDVAMLNCLFARGVVAVTAELSVKYKKPVWCDKKSYIFAKIDKAYPPLYLLSATISQDNVIAVEATAKFMEQDI
jgi:acyl-coenzyme A thioesterase PaaI-like protein